MDAPKRIFAWSAFPTSHLVGTWGVTRYPDNSEHYILAAEHDRLMAEKDAEIARLREALADAEIMRDAAHLVRQHQFVHAKDAGGLHLLGMLLKQNCRVLFADLAHHLLIAADSA